MNHAIPGVNAGYITRHKLLEDHLRGQQQAVSSAMFAALGESLSKTPSLRDWLGPGATRRAIEKAKGDQSERAGLHPSAGRGGGGGSPGHAPTCGRRNVDLRRSRS